MKTQADKAMKTQADKAMKTQADKAMKTQADPVTIKYRNVSVPVYPVARAGGTYWRFTQDGKKITRASLAMAKDDALSYAKRRFNGGLIIDDYTQDQRCAIRRIHDADPKGLYTDRIITFIASLTATKNTGEAIDEFLAVKLSNMGDSPHHYLSLRNHLKWLPRTTDVGDIKPGDLRPLLKGAPRTRKNRRDVFVSFWAWCADHGYIELSVSGKTAPQMLEKPIVVRGVPATYTPAELRILLDNVAPQYLPWLAMAAFAGIRTEEIIPKGSSSKPPLAWEDIHWDKNIIVMRPRTAKMGLPRIIPLCAALKAWLLPFQGRVGVIGPSCYASNPAQFHAVPETTRLGRYIGGWKRNALRHSFITYRATQVGLGKTAMEAGNSESECKASYNAALSEDVADEWFSVMPVGEIATEPVAPEMRPKEGKLSEKKIPKDTRNRNT